MVCLRHSEGSAGCSGVFSWVFRKSAHCNQQSKEGKVKQKFKPFIRDGVVATEQQVSKKHAINKGTIDNPKQHRRNTLCEKLNTVCAPIQSVCGMPIQQVSVFLDNKPGTLHEMLAQLDCLKIKIYALAIAESGEFGVIRMIVTEPQLAAEALEDANFNVSKAKKNTEVVAILVSQENPVAKITKILGEGGINIEYAYSSAVHYEGKFVLLVRPKEVEKAENALKQNQIPTLTLEEIKQHFH